jgi:hypothetical protein
VDEADTDEAAEGEGAGGRAVMTWRDVRVLAVTGGTDAVALAGGSG